MSSDDADLPSDDLPHNDVDESADGDDDGSEVLDWDGVKQREQQKRQATKTIVLEYPDDSTAVFEYQMVEDVSSIAEQHTTRKPSRTGQEPRVSMDADQEWAFAADLFQEAIVSAPDGFKPTESELRHGLTKPVLDEMVEAIVEFSTAEEETYLKFR